jgi:hypothetical protein
MNFLARLISGNYGFAKTSRDKFVQRFAIQNYAIVPIIHAASHPDTLWLLSIALPFEAAPTISFDLWRILDHLPKFA